MPGIFSRKAVRWEVHVTETGDLAREFIENAIIGNGGAGRFIFMSITARQ
jgi:hypothetical protein